MYEVLICVIFAVVLCLTLILRFFYFRTCKFVLRYVLLLVRTYQKNRLRPYYPGSKLKNMADNTLNISPPFKFEVKTAPRGMTDYDPSAINQQQQELLNVYKINLMRENIAYVSRHPEVKGIFCWTGKYFYTVRPREMLERIGVKYTAPESKFRREIKKTLKNMFEVECELDESEGEDWDY